MRVLGKGLMGERPPTTVSVARPDPEMLYLIETRLAVAKGRGIEQGD